MSELSGDWQLLWHLATATNESTALCHMDQSEESMVWGAWSWCGYEGNKTGEGNVVIMGNWSSDICPPLRLLLYWLNSAWGSRDHRIIITHYKSHIISLQYPAKTPNVTLDCCNDTWHVLLLTVLTNTRKYHFVVLCITRSERSFRSAVFPLIQLN